MTPDLVMEGERPREPVNVAANAERLVGTLALQRFGCSDVRPRGPVEGRVLIETQQGEDMGENS